MVEKIIMSKGSNDRKRWSRSYESCIECGETKFKHVARGLCNSCYQRDYRNDPKNKKGIAKAKHRWWRKMGGIAFSKVDREQRWFANLREDVLERDGYKCVRCGSDEDLTVHHVDGEGRGSARPNNLLENLLTVCRACHARIHHGEKNVWSRKYDKCQTCGTVDRPHAAKGFCTICYVRLIRGQKRTQSRKPCGDCGTKSIPREYGDRCRPCYVRWRKSNQWSRSWETCQDCGTRKFKHQAGGLCSSCYGKQYRQS